MKSLLSWFILIVSIAVLVSSCSSSEDILPDTINADNIIILKGWAIDSEKNELDNLFLLVNGLPLSKSEEFDLRTDLTDNFDIDTLIAEEIHLNYPSIVYCCGTDNSDEISDEDFKKVKPFKKIRDLIK